MREYLDRLRSNVAKMVTVITSMLVKPEWANAFYQSLVQLYLGITPDKDVVPFLARAPRSRAVLWRSFWTNIICYAGIMLFYETCIRGLMRSTSSSLEDSYTEYSMDTMIRLCLGVSFLFDNMMLSMAIVKAGAIDNPASVRSCDCETPLKIQGRLASTIYYAGNSTLVMAAERMFPVAGPPLRAMLYGRQFVEQGAAGGMCTNHRNDVLNRNNMYSLGVGLSFMIWQYAIKWGVNYALQSRLAAVGVENVDNFETKYLGDALFYFLTHYYLMTLLSNNKPLPGSERGLDIAKPGRAITRLVIKQSLNQFFGYHFALMTPETILKEGVIYFGIKEGKLAYTVITPRGDAVRDIPIPSAEFPVRELLLIDDILPFKDKLLKITAKAGHTQLTWCLNQSDKTVSWAMIKRYLDHPYARMAEKMLWGADVDSLSVFLKKPIPRLVFNFYDETIMTMLNRLVRWRNGLVVDLKIVKVPYYLFIDFVPAKYAPDYKKWIVNMVKGSSFNEYIEQTRQYIHWVRRVQTGVDMPESERALQAVSFVPDGSGSQALLQLPASSAAAAAASQAGQLLRRPSVSPASMDSRLIWSSDEVAALLKKIAYLDSWKTEGVTVWGGQKVPDGVIDIRRANADLIALYNAVRDKVGEGAKSSGLPSGKRTCFYILIKECFLYQNDLAECKRKIDKFCEDYLNLSDRQSIGITPSSRLSQMGSRR